MLSTTTIPETQQSVKCLLCGDPTTGSVGAAGLFWKSICQPCKDKEDADLLDLCKVVGGCVDAVLQPEPKPKCGDPFCDFDTDFDGRIEADYCPQCKEHRAKFGDHKPLNYKDESGPDETPTIGIPAGINPIYLMSDEEWAQEQRDREEASRAYDHEDRDMNDEVAA